MLDELAALFAATDAAALPCCVDGRPTWSDQAGALRPTPCACVPAERVLRAYAYGANQGGLPALSAQQRAWMAREADRAAEGALRADELLRDADDAGLARALLGACADYAYSQGVL